MEKRLLQAARYPVGFLTFNWFSGGQATEYPTAISSNNHEVKEKEKHELMYVFKANGPAGLISKRHFSAHSFSRLSC
jgi:hypothetical protein